MKGLLKMETNLDPWECLKKEYPKVADAIDRSIGNIMELAELDEKTKQLVYIAAQTAVNYPLAVKYHAALAIQAGATRDEIVGAASIAASVAGPKGFVRCFPSILEGIEGN